MVQFAGLESQKALYEYLLTNFVIEEVFIYSVNNLINHKKLHKCYGSLVFTKRLLYSLAHYDVVDLLH